MGRYLIFILVLANLVFFLWNYSQPRAVPETEPAEIPADVQSLTLLHEKNFNGKKTSAVDTQAALQPDAASRSGPVATRADDRQTARSQAASTGLKPTPEEVSMASDGVDETEQEDEHRAALDEGTAGVSAEKANRGDQIRCYTLGPFLDTQIVETIAAEIKAIGFPVTQRSLEEREIKHYWIYLPPFKSDALAQAASRKLAKNGIKDYFIVTTDENRNAISLGLFKRQTGAKRRARHIRELGFKPKIEVRYRNKTYYWLDYEETGDKSLPSQLWKSIETDKGPVQSITRDCT